MIDNLINIDIVIYCKQYLKEANWFLLKNNKHIIQKSVKNNYIFLVLNYNDKILMYKYQ